MNRLKKQFICLGCCITLSVALGSPDSTNSAAVKFVAEKEKIPATLEEYDALTREEKKKAYSHISLELNKKINFRAHEEIMVLKNTKPEDRSLKLPATLEEYDALAPEEAYKAYFFISKELRDKHTARAHAQRKAGEERIKQENEARGRAFMAGRSWMMDTFGYLRKLRDTEIKLRYPDDQNPDRLKLLKQSQEDYERLCPLLGLSSFEAQVVVWEKYKPMFEKLGERYPLSKVTRESVEALEKELKPMIEDLKKLPRIYDKSGNMIVTNTNSVATPSGSPSK